MNSLTEIEKQLREIKDTHDRVEKELARQALLLDLLLVKTDIELGNYDSALNRLTSAYKHEINR